MARLCVQILTFNEERDIVDCLDSVKNIADEIVVVDTGSTDETVKLGRSLGAKIVYADWSDNFATARNTGLSHATADWILILDADERLASSAEELLPILENPAAEAASVCIENIIDELTSERVVHSAIRLFRARSEYRFEGRIHEEIASSILKSRSENTIVSSPLRIVHYGYAPAVMECKDKVQRNLRILTAALSEQPDNPFYLYHLGITQSQLGQWEVAKIYMMKALATLPVNTTYRSTLVRDTAKVLLRLGEFQEAQRFIQQHLCQYPDYPDLHHWNGVALEALGYLERAFGAYQLATQCTVDPHRFVTDDGVTTFRSYHKMGELALRMNRNEVAHEAFTKALEIQPQFEPALLGYADTLHRLGMTDRDILAQLRAICSPKQPRDEWRLAKVMFDIGAYGPALDVMNTAEPLREEAYPTYYQCLIYNRKYSEARTVIQMLLAQVHPVSPPVPREVLAIDLALCYWAEGGWVPADAYGMLPDEQADAIRQIQDFLCTSELASEPERNRELDPLFHTVMDRMVRFGLPALAETLTAVHPDAVNQLPFVWYTHGFTILASNRLLDFMKQRVLNPSELCMVAEVLLVKGHYEPALQLFEEAAATDPKDVRAHRGAAQCYLRLARDTVVKGLQRHPNHPTLSEDLQQIEANLNLLAGLPGTPCWAPAQRRNMLVRSINFSVHDREK